MKRYAITDKAGRFVAGQSNTGVGSILTLTDKQAEHEVRLGTLQPLDQARSGKAVAGKGKTATKPVAKPAADDVTGEGTVAGIENAKVDGAS